MKERDHLITVVQSLTDVLEATRSKPMLHQLVNMAVLEASEGLVRAGFEPARLNDLGVADELAYLIDAQYCVGSSNIGPGDAPPPVPYLRLVCS
jgi:hypothetical protein